jgi:hypothetical protein
MSKTNDTSKLASRDRELRDDELDVVTGGMLTFSNSDFDDVLPTASGANGHVK